MLRLFFESFWHDSWNNFFKNVIKSIKNSLKYIQLNHLWQNIIQKFKYFNKKLFIHEIKHTPKLKKDWL